MDFAWVRREEEEGKKQRKRKYPACIHPQAEELPSPDSCTHNPTPPRAFRVFGCCAACWCSGWTHRWPLSESTVGNVGRNQRRYQSSLQHTTRSGDWSHPLTCLLTTKEMLPPFSVIADFSFFFSLKGKSFSSKSTEQFSNTAMPVRRGHTQRSYNAIILNYQFFPAAYSVCCFSLSLLIVVNSGVWCYICA